MALTLNNLNAVNGLLRTENELDEKRWAMGANEIMSMMGHDYKIPDNQVSKAKQFVYKVFYNLLDEDEYLLAASLAFGFDYFSAQCQYSKDVFRVVCDYPKVCLIGGASTSKTFSCGIYFSLDYVRDPGNTKVLMASLSGGHLKSNLFPSIINALDASVIDFGLESSIASMRIWRKGDEAQSNCIFGRLFQRDSERSSGGFRGAKPDPRKKPHPEFGKLGRVRILIDEASSVPAGVFKDLGSPEGSIEGKDRVKIVMAYNPTDVGHPTASPYGVPSSGIDSLNPDEDYEWTSEKGYHVLRLDGAKSENVVAGKEIISGIQTRDGFVGYQTAGENSADYWIYGRGFWPIKGVTATVIPSTFLTSNRGDYKFPETAYAVGSADIAFTTDKFVMCVGKYGKASHYQDSSGKQWPIKDRNGNEITRVGLQIDGLIEIPLCNDSVRMAEQIMENCKRYGIRPEWFVMDATSYGKGVYDILRSRFGDILGVNWQESATEYRILAEDEDTPEKTYANISTEMWYATRIWLEHGIIKFSHNMNTNELFSQLNSRRFKPAGKRGREIVESKVDYKKRTPGGKSPDHSDSLIQLPMLCRARGEWLPSISGRDEDTGGALDEADWMTDSIEEIDCLTMDNYTPDYDPTPRWPSHGEVSR